MLRLRSAVALFVACFLGLTATAPPANPQEAKDVARARVDALIPEIRQMALTLWDYSEIALEETRSAALLADRLAAEGFTVERGVAGMPTAFIARWGSGRPMIGILAEYDALPGVGNEAVPERAPREGVTSGHGCGHNLFGAASVGAALALQQTMEAQGLPGTVVLYGAPAEETVVGKVYMARDRVFDELDAALEWHPSTETEVRNQTGRAMNNFTVEFFGQAAHGAHDPWNGRSALDAVELMNHAANMMREHIEPTARIHYVIPGGGEAPNVVPEYAKVWYYVRDVDRPSVEAHYAWLLDIARAAALATRTEHKVTMITGVHEMLLNRPLQEALQANLEAVGPPRLTDEDQEFARALQRSLGIEEKGYETAIEPLASEPGPVEGGSTDVAEVSYIVPTAGFRVTTAAADIPWHSWAASACHGTEAGIQGAVVAAQVLTLTGVDLLTDPGLVERAQAFFDQASGGREYVSPLPEGQTPPVP